MLIGHNKQWQFIKKMVAMHVLPHAFLFSGEDQLGKKKFALELIKTLNCQSLGGNGEPCQKCYACRSIESGIYPDAIVIVPKGKEIQISQIRDFGSRLALKPSCAYWKVGIVDQAHQMTKEAQQAFLKTLEEPKGNTLIFLISSYPELILPTIKSRAQQIKFFPVSSNELSQGFLEMCQEKELMTRVGEISWGKPGRAMELLSDPQKIKEYDNLKKDFLSLWKADLANRFQYAKKIAEEQDDLPKIIELWIRLLRDQIKKTIGGNTEHDGLSYVKCVKNLQNLNFLISKSNINPRLALELVFLEL